MKCPKCKEKSFMRKFMEAYGEFGYECYVCGYYETSSFRKRRRKKQ